MARKRFKDFTGKQHGLWDVIQFVGWENTSQTYLCRDVFGEHRILCYKRLAKTQIGVRFMSSESRSKMQKIYDMYRHMLARCYNPRHPAFYRYGGKGIRVQEDWLGDAGYLKFVRWAVLCGWQLGLYIDRIDNAAGYTPGNCRFVSASASGRHISTARLNLALANSLRESFKITPLSKQAFCRNSAQELEVSMQAIYDLLDERTWRN